MWGARSVPVPGTHLTLEESSVRRNSVSTQCINIPSRLRLREVRRCMKGDDWPVKEKRLRRRLRGGNIAVACQCRRPLSHQESSTTKTAQDHSNRLTVYRTSDSGGSGLLQPNSRHDGAWRFCRHKYESPGNVRQPTSTSSFKCVRCPPAGTALPWVSPPRVQQFKQQLVVMALRPFRRQGEGQ